MRRLGLVSWLWAHCLVFQLLFRVSPDLCCVCVSIAFFWVGVSGVGCARISWCALSRFLCWSFLPCLAVDSISVCSVSTYLFWLLQLCRWNTLSVSLVGFLSCSLVSFWFFSLFLFRFQGSVHLDGLHG